MQVDYDIAMEIASHEAIVRQAYKDSEGVWTWSVGLTNATGHDVTRYIGKPQPIGHCLEIYVWALLKYADDVREAFEGCALTKAQFAAALSFHWNTGQIHKATWVKLFKAGKVAEARKAFMNYSKPKAIIPRRRKEQALFFDGQWSNVGTMTEYTKLTVSGTPIWSSGKRIHVAKELKALFAPVAAPPAPAKPVPVPTPQPKPQTPPAATPRRTNALTVALVAVVSASAVFFDKIANWIMGFFQ